MTLLSSVELLYRHNLYCLKRYKADSSFPGISLTHTHTHTHIV